MRPRGDAADPRDAPLRRPADRRRRPPPGEDRRDEDRRGQDPRRPARRDPQRASTGRGVHLVTVNDYLARRDPQWMGPIYHFLGVSVGMITHDTAVRLRARLPDDRRAARQPAPGHPPRGLRRGRHLRHEQRVRLRLPARQHGHGARPAGPARALLRDRRRGRQHPHRRGPDAAHHQRPGRGVGRPVLHLRPPRPPLQPRPEGDEEGGDYFVDLKDRAVSPTEDGIDKMEKLARRREPLRRRSAPGPPLRAGPAGPRPLQARPRLHRQGRRDRHRRRVHRPPDARPALERGPPPGDRGEGGPAGPARDA